MTQPPQGYYPPQPPPYGLPPAPKKNRTWKIVLGILGAIAVIMVIAVIATAASNTGNVSASGTAGTTTSAPPAATTTTTPPAPSGPQSLSAGQTLEVTENGQPAAHILVSKFVSTTYSADGFSSPQNGYFLIVTVTVTSETNGFNVNDLDFYVLENGNHYQYGNGNSFDATSGANNDLTTMNGLNSGESETGQLVFDVPATHGQLVYAPNYQGGPIAEWSF
jgi:hypothetical protein